MDIKQKNLTTIGLSLAITLAVGFLIIKPTIIYIRETRDRINNEREDLEKQYQRVIYLKKNYEKIKEIEEQLEVLDDLFLIQDQELEFITALENIAAKNNVTQKINLKKIDLNDPEQKTMPFDITITGTTQNVVTYLLKIEQLEYYINFQSISINAISNITSSSGRSISRRPSEGISIKMDGEIYLLKL